MPSLKSSTNLINYTDIKSVVSHNIMIMAIANSYWTIGV